MELDCYQFQFVSLHIFFWQGLRCVQAAALVLDKLCAAFGRWLFSSGVALADSMAAWTNLQHCPGMDY